MTLGRGPGHAPVAFARMEPKHQGGDESQDLEGLPTTVRAPGADDHDDDWESQLPVPPPVEHASSFDEDSPTLAPAELEVPADEGSEPPEAASAMPEGQDFFKIGEVARIVGVKPYVIRYWESEFAGVRPEKTSTRQRRYRRQDVALLLQIRRLRHDEKLSIARIRVLLKRGHQTGVRDDAEVLSAVADTALPTSAGVPGGASAVVGKAAGSGVGAPPAEIRQTLDDMRRAVLDLLEAVED